MPAIISGHQQGLLNSSLTSIGQLNGEPRLGQNQGLVHINAATGNLVLQNQDVIQMGLGSDINLLRTYNSSGRYQPNDAFRFNWQKRIEGTQNDRNVVVHHGDGSYSVFEKSHDDANGRHFVSTDGQGAHDTLTYSNRQWTLTEGSTQTDYLFGKSGAENRQLIAVTDSEGWTTAIEYTAWGDVKAVEDSSGQRLEFDYVKPGYNSLVSSIRSMNQGNLQAATHYQYDSLDRLSKVIVDLDASNATLDDNGDGILNDQSDSIYITEYQYYEPSELIGDVRVQPHDDLIKSVRQTDGTLLSVFYVSSDSGWRVKSTVVGEGNERQVMRFDYYERRTDVTQVLDNAYAPADDHSLVTTIPNSRGITTSYEYDDKERLYRVISSADENGQRLITSYHYDSDDNVVSVTDGRNQTVYMTYDEKGNQLSRLDAAGNTTQYAYNENNQLIRSTNFLQIDPDGLGPRTASEPQSTWFVFDDKDRMRFSVDAEGRVTETRYEESSVYQREHSEFVYSDSVFDLSGYDQDNELNLSDLESWIDSISDYSGVQRTDRYFDFRDQLTQIIGFSKTDATTGEGVDQATVQRFVYNEKGQILQSFDLENTVDWSKGHLRNDVVNGAWPSELEFRSTTYNYDGMGRLFSSVDAASNTTQYLYGVGVTEERGSIAITHANGLRVLTVADSTGRVIQQVEQEVSQGSSQDVFETKSETHYFYDALGRQIGSLDPTGVVSQEIFDDVGRTIATIDGNGALVEYIYNENGLLIEQISYANFLSEAQLGSLLVKDSDGKIIGLTHPEKANPLDDLLSEIRPDASGTVNNSLNNATNDRHSYFFYDAADRLIYSVDGEGAIRKNIYDGTGQLIHEIAFSETQGVEAVRALLNPTIELVGNSGIVSNSTNFDASDADTAQLTDGRYVTVWTQDGKVFAQTFSADGVKQGDAILVRDDDYGWEPSGNPVVTHLHDGGFAVFWEGLDSYEWDPKPKAEWQRFYADGTRKRHNTYISAFPYYEEGRLPAVTTLEDGSVVLVQQLYRRSSNFDRFGWDVHAVRFGWDEDEQTLGTISPNLTYGIVSFDEGHEEKVDIAALDNGGFVMTWQATDGDETGIKGKRFYKDGIDNETFVNDDFFINQDTLGPQSDASVVQLKGGEFFSVWQSTNALGESVIKARGYGADRFDSLNEYVIAVDEGLSQESLPTVTELDDGSLIVVWQSTQNGETVIRAQHLDARGEKKHDSFVLNTTGESIASITIESLYGNRAVVNWSSVDADGLRVVKQQLLGLPKDPIIADDWVSEGNRVMNYLYDASGLLVATVDQEQFMQSMLYDAAGQLIEERQLTERVSDSHFTDGLLVNKTLGDITPSANDNDRISRHYFNQTGQRVGVLNADGYLATFEYNGIGEIKEAKRFNQQVSESLRGDNVDSLLSTVNASTTRVSQFIYTARKQLKQSINEEGLVTQHKYNSVGQRTNTITFDSLNNSDQNLTREVIMTYDVQGRAIAQQNPLDQLPENADQFKYDAAGRLIESTDSNGLSTWYFYDQLNRISHKMNELGEVQIFEYNAFGEVNKTVVPGERLSIDVNDAPPLLSTGGLVNQELIGLFNSLISDGATVHEQSYDRRGLLLNHIDGEQNNTHHRYNIFGEKIQISQHKSEHKFAHQLFAYNKRSELTRQVSYHQSSEMTNFDELAEDTNIQASLATEQQWELSAFGEMSQYIDGEGVRFEYLYDQRGNVVVEKVNSRNINSHNYDGFSRLTSSIDGLNRVTQYQQRLREVITTTAEGIENSVLRNAYGEVIERIDGNNGKILTSFDKQGNLFQIRDAEGGVQSFEFDAENRMTFSTDSRGITTRYLYDAANRLEQTVVDIDAADHTGLTISQKFVFNAKGEVEAQINANGITRTFEYDNNSRLVKETLDPSGIALIKKYSYDGLGNILRLEEGHKEQSQFVVKKTTNYQYDALSRLQQEEVISEHQNQLVTDRTAFEYDNKNQLTVMTMSSGESVNYQYSDRGDIVTEWDSSGLVKTMSYDNNRNLIRSTIHSEAAQFDQDGNLQVPENKPNDRTSFFIYDQDNRLTTTIDPRAAVNQFTYDDNNNLIESLSLASFHSELHQALSLLVEPATNIDSQTYQQLIALMSGEDLTTSQDDRRVINLFDALNRNVLSVDGEGLIQFFAHDSESNLIHSVQYNSDITWSQYASVYQDSTLTSTEKLTSILSTIAQDAIANDRISTQTDLHAFYYFDAANRLTGTIDSLGYIDLYDYDAEGNQKGSSRLSTSIGESQFNQWASSSFILNTSDDLLSFAETSRTSNDQSQAFGYDAANRLSSKINHEGSVSQWQYDSIGNLTQHVTGQDSLNQAFSMASDAQKIKREYDSQGRVISETSFDVTEDNGVISEYIASTLDYAYDESGRLIEKNNNGDRTLYFYEQGTNRLTHQVVLIKVDADGEPASNDSSSTLYQGEVTHWVYNLFGEQKSETRYATRIDADGLTGGLNDTLGSRIVIATDADSTTEKTYNQNGLQQESLDAEGNLVSSIYNAFSEVSQFIAKRPIPEVQNQPGLADTSTAVFEYDKRGLQRHRLFDATLNNSSQWDAKVKTSQVYDAFGRHIVKVDGNGMESVTRYDALGRVTDVIDPIGRKKTTEFDAFNRVVKEFDALGNLTEFTHNDETRSLTITFADGSQMTSFANRQGETVEVTDNNGATHTYEYDRRGNLVQETNAKDSAAERIIENQFDSRNLIISSIKDGYQTTFEYDSARRLVRETIDTEGDSFVTTTLFDAKGNEIRRIDSDGTETLFHYDNNNRLTWTVIDPDGEGERHAQFTHLYYDASGNKTVEETGYINQQAVTESDRYIFDDLKEVVLAKETQYDSLNRRVAEIIDSKVIAEFVYDTNDNLTQIIDSTGAITHQVYDEANQLFATISPTGNVSRFWYDAQGNNVAQVDYHQRYQGEPILESIAQNYAVIDNKDAATFTAFNERNDVEYIIDGEGFVEQWVYDSNQKVSQTIRYAQNLAVDPNERLAFAADTSLVANRVIDASPIDNALSQLSVDQAKDHIQYKIYNERDLLEFEIDGQGFVKQHRYGLNDSLEQTTRLTLALDFNGDRSIEKVREDWIRTEAQSEGRSGVIYYDARGRIRFEISAYDDLGNPMITEFVYSPEQKNDGISYLTLTKSTYASAIVMGNDWQSLSTQDFAARFDTNSVAQDISVSQVQEQQMDQLGNNVHDIQYLFNDSGEKISAQVNVNRYSDQGYLEESFVQNYGIDSNGQVNFDAPLGAKYQHSILAYDNQGRIAERFTSTTTDTTGSEFVATASVFEEDQNANVVVVYGFFTAYEYDEFDNIKKETVQLTESRYLDGMPVDGRQRITDYQYDKNRQVEVTTVSEHFVASNGSTNIQVLSKESFTYDAFGNQETVTYYIAPNTDESLVSVTHMTYDSNQRLTSKTEAYETDVASTTRHYYHEAYGTQRAPILDQEPLMSLWQPGYRLQSIENAKGQVTYQVTDQRGLVVATVSPDNAIIQTAYDAFGNITSSVNANGNESRFVYDNQNQLRFSIEPGNIVTEYRYNSDNRLEYSIVYAEPLTVDVSEQSFIELKSLVEQNLQGDPKNQVSYQEYNSLGQMTVKVLNYDATKNVAEQVKQTYTYNALGQRVSMIDSRGNKTVFLFDAAGREVGTIQPTGIDSQQYTTIKSYDVYDRQTHFGQVGYSAAEASYFDSLGREQLSINNLTLGLAGTSSNINSEALDVNGLLSEGLGIQRQFDGRGNLITETTPEGNQKLFFYNLLNQQVASVDAEGYVTLMERDALGNVTKERTINVTVTDVDSSLRETLLTQSSMSELVASFGLTNNTDYREFYSIYDVNQRVTHTGSSQNIVNYSINDGKEADQNTRTFVYDDLGNVIRRTDAMGNSVRYFFNSNNQLSLVVTAEGVATHFEYDSFGNQTRLTKLNQSITASLTDDTKLSEVNAVFTNEDQSIRWTFDSLNRQTMKIVENFHYDDRDNSSINNRTANAVQITHYSYAEEINGNERDSGINLVTKSDVGAYQVSATGSIVFDWTNDRYQLVGSLESQDVQYDALGRKVLETSDSYRGYTSVNGWSLGNINQSTQFQYNYFNQLTKEQRLDNNNSAVLTQTYDYNGSRLEESFGYQQHITYEYDKDGNVSSQFDFDKLAETVFEYYDNGLLKEKTVYQIQSVTNGVATRGSELQRQRMDYNAFNEITGVYNNNHLVEQSLYDNAGRLVRSNQGDGTFRLYGYDSADNKTLEIQILEKDKLSTISDLNELYAELESNTINSESLKATLFTYDSDNRLVEVKLVKDTFNASNIDWKSVLENAQTSTQRKLHQEFDSFGNVTHRTDAKGNRVQHYYNTLNEVIAEQRSGFTNIDGTSVAAPTTHYYYDGQGRQVAMRDARGNLTQQTFVLDKVSQVINADGSRFNYHYDALGEIRNESKQRINGVTDFGQRYVRDYSKSSEKLSNHNFASDSGQWINGRTKVDSWYTNDPQRNTESVLSRSGDWLRSETTSFSAYQLSGTTSRSYVGSRILTSYQKVDALGRVATAQKFDGSVTSNGYSFYQGGFKKLSSVTHSGGSRYYRAEWSDYHGRMVTQGLLSSSVSTPNQITINYNGFGQIDSKVGGGTNIEFKYDLYGRKVNAQNHLLNTTTNYEYDRNDNLTKETISGVQKGLIDLPFIRTQEYGYNNQNWLERIEVDGSAKANYSFDAQGNRTRINDRVYAYDGMNRMETVGNTSITYDARGLRLTETTGSKVLGYTYTIDGQLDTVSQNSILVLDNDYNLAGMNTQVKQYESGNLTSVKTSSYDVSGRLIHETHDARTDDQNDKRVGMRYDVKGNVDKVVTRTNLGDGDVDTYTQTTAFAIKGDSWQKTFVRMQGSTNRERIKNSKWHDGISSFSYATDGSLQSVTKYDVNRNASSGGTLQETLKYTYDANGSVINRYSKTQNTDAVDKEKWNDVYDAIKEERNEKQTAKTTAYINYIIVSADDDSTEAEIQAARDNYNLKKSEYDDAQANFQEAEAAKNGGFEERVKAIRGDAYTPPMNFFYYQGKQFGQIDLTSNTATFDLNYKPTERTAATYYRKVNAGETLRSIAAQTYGDQSLWYIIANANGLSSESVSAGREVLIPHLNDNQTNNYDSFKPYSSSEVIGNTDPYLPSAPPPEKSCKDIAVIITAVIAAVIVAAVITIATAGVATAAGVAAGAAVGGGVIGTIASVTATVVVGAAIGATAAAAASAISQGILIAGGVQESFDLDEFAKSIIIGAATGFVTSAFGAVAQSAQYAKVAASAAKYGSNIAKAAKLGARSAQIAKIALKGGGYFAKGAVEGTIGALAGEAYDSARGNSFDSDEILFGAIQGGLSEVGGAVAGKFAKNRNTLSIGARSVEIGKITSSITATISAIGSSFAAEGIRSAAYGKEFDALNATIDSLGDLAGIASAKSFARISDINFAKGAYNVITRGRKNVVTSVGGDVNVANKNSAREIGVKSVKPSELGQYNGDRARIQLNDHGGFDLGKGEFTVGGKTATELAQVFADAGVTKFDTLSLASCSAGNHNHKGSTFANDLFGALKAKNIQVNRITARTGEVSILANGRKVMTDANGGKVFHGDKVVVTSENIVDNTGVKRTSRLANQNDLVGVSDPLPKYPRKSHKKADFSYGEGGGGGSFKHDRSGFDDPASSRAILDTILTSRGHSDFAKSRDNFKRKGMSSKVTDSMLVQSKKLKVEDRTFEAQRMIDHPTEGLKPLGVERDHVNANSQVATQLTAVASRYRDATAATKPKVKSDFSHFVEAHVGSSAVAAPISASFFAGVDTALAASGKTRISSFTGTLEKSTTAIADQAVNLRFGRSQHAPKPELSIIIPSDPSIVSNQDVGGHWDGNRTPSGSLTPRSQRIKDAIFKAETDGLFPAGIADAATTRPVRKTDGLEVGSSKQKGK